MNTFEQAYTSLNAGQKQAVDTIEGPVLVVAGPGTGKTQLLSMRAANILKLTDAEPSNVLCLTFTNKAALNMRERLQQLAGPEARKVVVRTFHSFAAEIMNQYPDHFWSGARLSVAPDAVQEDIIQSILSELPLDNPLASVFAGSFTALPGVKDALKLAKEAGLKPDELRLIVRENLAYIDVIEKQLCEILSPTLSIKKLTDLQDAINELPEQSVTNERFLLPLSTTLQESLALAVEQDQLDGKTTQTGKWKRRWLQTVNGEKGMYDERRRNQWWLSVADVYEQYRDALHQRGYYDYADMLVEVLEQLEKNPDMLADVQERFLYVLIDEFQDTNAAQLRLSHMIADHFAANNRPNIMAVGDDDQSIFAFNGAELNNMLHFQRSYPDTKTIVLEDNYRSSQAVLDTAKTVIELADDRLIKRTKDLSKNLRAQVEPSKPSTLSHINYPTKAHQYSAVARHIKEAWDNGERSIAVVARKHESLQQLASILNRIDVPLSYERQSNVLEHEAVQQVCLIAQTVVAISNGDMKSANVNLSRLLRHPMWQLSPVALWKLAIQNYSSPDYLGSLMASDDPALQNIGSWMLWLSRTCQSEPLPRSLEYILGMEEGQYMLSPFRAYYLDHQKTSSTYIETLSAIQLLRQMSLEFAGRSEATLEDFVRFIELNLTNKRVIANESWFASSDQAVQLLTIYKAKGLEFDTVYLVDGIESMWSPRTSRRKSPANLRLQSYGENDDDYVRLMYVAATRAKHTFIVSSYATDEKGTELLPTSLVASLPLTIVSEPQEESVSVLENNLRWPELSTADEKALLKERLESFALSPTALIDFLNVAEAGPDTFKERQLLRLPHPHSASGSYGTAIHAALETAQRLVNTAVLEPNTVIDRFESALENEYLSPREHAQLLARGEKLLPLLIEQADLLVPKGALSEQFIEATLEQNARIKGKLDSLLVTENSVLVSDYKTGKPLASFATKDKLKMIKAWRHRVQLQFYCLLVRESGRYKTTNVTAQMLYVEAETPKAMQLDLQPSDEELDKLQKLITIVWQRVQDLDFPDVSKYSEDIEGIIEFENDLISGTI
ncbi:ATP-dependent helicase [Candidatus Saccharibacteria bacterium]|nr:ATP-dependent helicase [Candidatus Saccharibacteria bacterium]